MRLRYKREFRCGIQAGKQAEFQIADTRSLPPTYTPVFYLLLVYLRRENSTALQIPTAMPQRIPTILETLRTTGKKIVPRSQIPNQKIPLVLFPDGAKTNPSPARNTLRTIPTTLSAPDIEEL